MITHVEERDLVRDQGLQWKSKTKCFRTLYLYKQRVCVHFVFESKVHQSVQKPDFLQSKRQRIMFIYFLSKVRRHQLDHGKYFSLYTSEVPCRKV
jgi:hypothetical protein